MESKDPYFANGLPEVLAIFWAATRTPPDDRASSRGQGSFCAQDDDMGRLTAYI
jgi:hypothetical protein